MSSVFSAFFSKFFVGRSALLLDDAQGIAKMGNILLFQSALLHGENGCGIEIEQKESLPLFHLKKVDIIHLGCAKTLAEADGSHANVVLVEGVLVRLVDPLGVFDILF